MHIVPDLRIGFGSVRFLTGGRFQLHYDKGKTIDEENDIRAFFGVFDESPLVGNGKVVIGRIFEINKGDEGGAFLAIYKVFYRDTVLQIVGKGHVLLQQ